MFFPHRRYPHCLKFYSHSLLFHRVRRALFEVLLLPTHMLLVTTRTTSLTPVPLASFALRFSDLGEIEDGCREDEEQRAGRTIDWISARISSRCAKWLEDWERVEAAAAQNERANSNLPVRTPWWNELRLCVEGDHIPSKSEGWNHPVASVCFFCWSDPGP